MRILSILAVIAATATPALAANDIKDREAQVKIATSVQVEKAAHVAFDASATAQKADRYFESRRDR